MHIKNIQRLAQHRRQVAQLQAIGRLRLRMGVGRGGGDLLLPLWGLRPPSGMGPVDGVGSPRTILVLEVLARERLHRGLAHGNRFGVCGVEVIDQLAHQHAGVELGLVGGLPALPADVDLFTRAQQGFQEQKPIVFAARAIAWAAHAGPAHQVKVAHGLSSRVLAVVHAQQTHPLEWDGAHGHEGRKLHPCAQETVAGAGVGQARHPMGTDHRQ